MKSTTDHFWNQRVRGDTVSEKVNIADTVQRDLELTFIRKHLNRDLEVLEVGCGNGYVTQQIRDVVSHIDGMDYAENMIDKAKELWGEKNNKFILASVLDKRSISRTYNCVLCVRVLINLRNQAEQELALENIADWLQEGGVLLLVEGFQEGFDELNQWRGVVGIEALSGAAINYYSHLSKLMPKIESLFAVEDEFHTGTFDFLTRVVYPSLVGENNATGPSDFHSRIQRIAERIHIDDLKPVARVRGFKLRKKHKTFRS